MMKIRPILSHLQKEEIGQISSQKATVSEKNKNSAPLLTTRGAENWHRWHRQRRRNHIWLDKMRFI